MPNAAAAPFIRGLRESQSPADKEVGRARTSVFQQSDFFRQHFLNNPKAKPVFLNPGLTGRADSETGGIPADLLNQMNVAGNQARQSQGRQAILPVTPQTVTTTPEPKPKKKKKEEQGRGSARSALLLSGGGGKLG